jgi:hypothetical protein
MLAMVMRTDIRAVRSLTVAIQCVLILAPIASGQVAPVPVQPAQQAAPAKEEPPGRIEGSVANAISGEPIKRATIVFMPAENRPDANFYSASTDAAGKFVVPRIAPGRYRASADRTGFVRTEYGAKGSSRMGTTITVASGQEMKNIDLLLQPHAVIAGRQAGSPTRRASRSRTLTFRR